MNQKVNLQQVAPLLIVVLLFVALLALLVPAVGRGTPVSIAPPPPAKTADLSSVDAFNAAEAADISAARWQAMARFYEEKGLLTRSPFDYKQAAVNQAARWQAMGRFYEEQGMLTRASFSHGQAAELSAYRWQAMARFYEEMGWLNDEMDAGDVAAYRWNAMARAYERMGLLTK